MKGPVMETELLPVELLWAEGSHASDIALTALADGQHAIVPDAVRAHVERCPACLAQLGHTALLSLETGRSFAAVRRPIPRIAVLLGLVAAVIGVVPSLEPAASLSMLTRTLASMLARVEVTGASTLGIIVTYVASIALVVLGLGLSRLSPKKEVSS